MRILVVDDNPDDIIVLSRAIKRTMTALAADQKIGSQYLLRSEMDVRRVSSLVFSAGSTFSTLESKLASSSMDSVDSTNSSSLSGGVCYDLIFMDTDMPCVKGYELCRSLIDECDTRKVDRIHIFGMSGRKEESVFMEWQQAGAKGFFEKKMLFGLPSSAAPPSLYHSQGKTVLEGVICNYISTIEQNEFRACLKTPVAVACGAPGNSRYQSNGEPLQ